MMSVNASVSVIGSLSNKSNRAKHIMPNLLHLTRSLQFAT